MSNSSLVEYIKISPNKTSPRKHNIDTITIHCVVGQASVERLGEIFSRPERKASSNYGIGYDGKIGLYVDENDRSWCSSSSSNDNRAITIEVASDAEYPYSVNEVAYNSLINLLVDICQRNNIPRLLWKDNKNLIGAIDKQNMTLHRWFANTACPGEYLYSHMYDIADRVNKRLGDFMERYNTLDEVPIYSYDTIKKLIDMGCIKGKGTSYDSEGYPADLDLSDDMVRLLVINDRAGLY